MIPTVDLSESNKLSDELYDHPLYKRRAAIEQQFLDELTALTRKFGLEIKADTRMEYGETYAQHVFAVPYAGTEGRYVIGTFGVGFESVKAKESLLCGPIERKQYDQAKAKRKEEDAVIDALSRRISDAHYKAMDLGMREMFERSAQEAMAKPQQFICACGSKFKTASRLKNRGYCTSRTVAYNYARGA